MKGDYLGLIILIIFLVALGLTNFSLYKEEVRPIKVRVLDGSTDEPVENAIVYHRIQTTSIRNILGAPIIDPVYYRDVVQKKYYTDKNGYIDIPRHKVSLRLYEKVEREFIYINLDLVEKTDRIEDFFEEPVPAGARINPIQYLKGATILSSKVELNLDIPEIELFKGILNENSLLKESDELIIRLERYDN